jgi:hypothetical protein
MAGVVMAAALGAAGHQRQDRRGAVQRLDLGPLVHAQHHRGLGRVQVQPTQVTDLVDELRVSGQLPGLPSCGLRPNARQIRLTAVWLISVARAIDRVDQWVASTGLRGTVAA